MYRTLFDRLPWWMNPRYPMGRRDYFVASIGVSIAALIPFAAFYALAVYLSNSTPDGEQFGEIFGMVVLIPWIFLALRRIKACKFPVAIFWCYMAVACSIGLAGLHDNESVAGVIGILDLILGLYLTFAPNKVEPVTSNPILHLGTGEGR